MSDSPTLLDLLPTERRLALAYAPARARGLTLGLLALDARLAETVRAVREPVLGQLRLAWWRDALTAAEGAVVSGEPVLAALAGWGVRRAALTALVDGWEEMLGEAPLPASAFEACAEGRARGWAALADRLGHDPGEAARAARGWALADLAPRLGHPQERSAALALAAAQDWRRPGLPRELRALAVLHGLARRTRGERPLLEGSGAVLVALRLGMLGR